METTYQTTFNVTILQYCIIALIGCIQVLLLSKGLKEKSKKNAGFLTSLGIFGTFLGIAVGLWFFDPADIDGSVKSLLGGMKIAFISSVMGLGSYLWLNYKIEDEISNEDVGMGDLLLEMSNGNKSMAHGSDGLCWTNVGTTPSISSL